MSRGKNFSGNDLGQRRAGDFYETPYSLTRLLLSRETLAAPVLEPACGGGAIVKVLTEAGYPVQAYDRDVDFFTERRPFPTVLTNPPYSLAREFIDHAKQIADASFFLLPLAYLHGKDRYERLYRDTEYPLRKVYVFTRYPMLGDPLREDGKHRTGMMVYAWFCFQRGHQGPPVVDWLDNDAYVLRGSARHD